MPSPSHLCSGCASASVGFVHGGRPFFVYVSHGHGGGKAMQPGGEPAARVDGPGQASGSCSPTLESQMRGSGLRAHIEPFGKVTLPSTKMALFESFSFLLLVRLRYSYFLVFIRTKILRVIFLFFNDIIVNSWSRALAPIFILNSL